MPARDEKMEWKNMQCNTTTFMSWFHLLLIWFYYDILIKWLKSKTENLLCKAVYKFVEVLRGDCPDVLVDNTVEIEVQGVVTSPEKVDYDIVINIHVGES